jgi:hypothetical protein
VVWIWFVGMTDKKRCTQGLNRKVKTKAMNLKTKATAFKTKAMTFP